MLHRLTSPLNLKRKFFLSTLASFGSLAPHTTSRFVHNPIQIGNFAGGYKRHERRRQHSSACQLRVSCAGGGAASIWHAILPSAGAGQTYNRRPEVHFELKGDGSWNAALDARPARWLHGADSAWLLFGVCACLAPNLELNVSDLNLELDIPVPASELSSEENIETSADYRVTGVPADGRCLFRAIAHVSCLRNGEEAPDEDRQKELADELRTQVVNELLKRRKETEWFIEGDFDEYVKRIERPYEWGGEPELLMASHVLKTPIWVFMRGRSSSSLVNIAKYGEEYGHCDENPISVLFHGYGHYDILETPSNLTRRKLNV
ncbi:hypothetical protein UlMin_026119 [Ulmus minor]